jgi:2,5-diamino-6-(ribosylamino)-4(3H)-pyrimidinone 5'-phosphate reductase
MDGDLRAYAKKICPGNIKVIEHKMSDRPYVIINVAMTADGKTDTISRMGAAISSPNDFDRVDRLRADCDAVMVGGHTLIENNPRLTIKSEALRRQRLNQKGEENPIKVAIITNAVLPADIRFLTFGPARKLIFTTAQTDLANIERLRKLGVQVIITDGMWVDLQYAMQQLKQAGVRQLLVEGGGTLNEELLKQKLVDEIQLYIAPMIFGGADAPTFVSGTGLDRDGAVQLKLAELKKDEDGGVLLRYLVKK